MKRLFFTSNFNSVRGEMMESDLAFCLPNEDFYNVNYNHILNEQRDYTLPFCDISDVFYEINYKNIEGYVEEYDINGKQSFFFNKNGEYKKIREFESYFDIKREKDVFGIRHNNVFLRKRNDLLNYLRSFDQIILQPGIDFKFIKEFVLFFKFYLDFKDDYIGRYDNLYDILKIEEINIFSKNKDNIIDLKNIDKEFSNITEKNHIIYENIKKYEAIEVFNFNFNIYSSIILTDILRSLHIYNNEIIDLKMLRTLYLIDQNVEMDSFLLHIRMIGKQIVNTADTSYIINKLKLLGFIEEDEVIKITDLGYELINMLSDDLFEEKFYIYFFNLVKDTPINEIIPYRKEIARLNDIFVKQRSHQTKKILKQISSYITEY